MLVFDDAMVLYVVNEGCVDAPYVVEYDYVGYGVGTPFVKAWSFHVWPRASLMMFTFLLWILYKMRVIMCSNVVSHRLKTKETLLKFSRNLTLNHIGESLGSRGGKA